MRCATPGLALFLAGLALAVVRPVLGQSGNMTVPPTVEAGSAFSVQTTGSGNATLYLVGPGQALRQNVQLGGTATFPAGSLFNSGHYLAVLVGATTTDQGAFDVVPAKEPVNLSFFAKPSRLPVGIRNGITGAVYVFDAYHNLITTPMPVSFELTNSSGTQEHTVTTQYGAAWTQMDSTAKEGVDKFGVRVEGVSSARVVEQVPGDPCGLQMSAKQSGQRLELTTAPVRDCSGNAVPDGTVVTFTENYDGTQSTVDVPLKHGIAQVEMPAHKGARVSVASGVVMGNEIHIQ